MTAPLTPAAERALYATDHAAWLRYAAPRLAARLAAMPEHELAFAWSLLTRPTQQAVWPQLTAAQQHRLRRARETPPEPSA